MDGVILAMLDKKTLEAEAIEVVFNEPGKMRCLLACPLSNLRINSFFE